MRRVYQRAPEALRRLAPPRPLALLLLVVVATGLVWSLTVPSFQAPDETAHFAYVQSLAENFELSGLPNRMGLSTDEGIAQSDIGALRGAFYPVPSPPDWSRADWHAYQALERSRARPPASDGSGFTSATGNPPLYYLVASAPYLIDHGGTVFGRLWAIRLMGVLLLALTALAAWLLAGEVVGRRRIAQLACAAVAALLPMATFISTAVTPDGMLMTTWTFALWLGARVINRRLPAIDSMVLCAVTAAAVLTKATSYALVGPVLLALLLGWLRRPGSERRAAALRAFPGLVILGVPVLLWVTLAPSLGGVSITHISTSVSHPFGIRDFLGYVWQFYLPRLPFMHPFTQTPQLGVYAIWVRELTGIFGWLDVYLPDWLYQLGAVSAGALSIGLIAVLVRVRSRRVLALLAFFALTVLALLVLLHVAGYSALISGGGAFLQGRYLLPAVGLLGLAVGVVLSRLPVRARPLACGGLVTALLAWQVISLVAIVEAYYL